MIKVIGKRLLIPNKDRLIGFEGDNRTGRLYFSFRKDFFTEVFGSESDLSVSAKLQAPGASKAVAYVLTPVADLSNDKESVYELEILSGMVQAVGEIKLQLILLKDMGKDENQSDIPDLEWNSETQSFYACDSLDFETYSGSAGSAQLDAFKELLSEIGAKAQIASESAAASSGSAASANGYAGTASEKAKAAAASEAACNASAGTASEKANAAAASASAAGSYAASAKAFSETAEGLAEQAAASAASASADAEAAGKAKGAAESAKEAAETAKAAALNAANDAKNEAFAAKSLAQSAMDASVSARAGAKSASDNAAASLSHMNEAARYSEEAKAAAKKVDGHIANTDNPHGVTAAQVGAYTKTETDGKISEAVAPVEDAVAGKLDKVTESYPVNRVYGVSMAGRQITLGAHEGYNAPGYIPVYNEFGVIATGTPQKDTDSVNKKYADDKAAGKLDKVSSYVRVYPGVYATNDTDGTPHLITATSDLGYIGNGSGYIPLYAAGGQLKTATPTAYDSAANKGYVDGKITALTKKYELIETITLTEETWTIERSVEPDGTAYNFKKLIIYMNASLTNKTGSFGVNLWDGTTLAARNVAFGSDMTQTKSDYIMELSVEDGILHQTAPSRPDNDYISTITKTAAATFYGGVKMMDKISKITINQYNGIAFAVGTVIKIYGVRA